METDVRDHSLPELLKQLSADIARLARLEVERATSELEQKVRLLPAFAIALVLAGAAGAVALGATGAFFILLLSLAMPAWLAALIVAIASVILAAGLVFVVKAQLPALVPKQTIAGIQEDIRWAKNRIESAGK